MTGMDTTLPFTSALREEIRKFIIVVIQQELDIALAAMSARAIGMALKNGSACLLFGRQVPRTGRPESRDSTYSPPKDNSLRVAKTKRLKNHEL